MQKTLFDDLDIDIEITQTTPARYNAGRGLVQKLTRLRRKLPDDQREFDFLLAVAIREIKYQMSLSDEKRRELVLFCIEEQHAHTWGEIADDSRLSQSIVRDILSQLEQENLIRTVERYTVGGSANQTLIFSNRKPCSCV